MSEAKEADEASASCCASCGIAEIDDVKLMECDGCDLVRYCSSECKEDHTSDHEEACKKRAAELRDELLFKQPEGTHLGDCPICCLPLPLDRSKSGAQACCSAIICRGCSAFNQLRQATNSLEHTCPFCRETLPRTQEEADKQHLKRLEANDPLALNKEAIVQGQKREFSRSFEYFTKAADLGFAEAHFFLSKVYQLGIGVEKDEGKKIYHTEEAAIGGHPEARHILGCHERDNANIEKAVKHWIIAATQGCNDSIKALTDAFKDGLVSKEVLAVTLRAHHAAVVATKSPQREAVEGMQVTFRE